MLFITCFGFVNLGSSLPLIFGRDWKDKTHGNRAHSETLTLVSPSCFQKKFRIVTDGNLPTLEMGTPWDCYGVFHAAIFLFSSLWNATGGRRGPDFRGGGGRDERCGRDRALRQDHRGYVTMMGEMVVVMVLVASIGGGVVVPPPFVRGLSWRVNYDA